MVSIDPPGTWCMNAAFFEMIGPLEKMKTFVEIGPGEGKMSKFLCSKGLSGIGIDFSSDITGVLASNLKDETASGQYTIIEADFMETDFDIQADLVFCFMVMEHIEDDLELVRRMKKLTCSGGRVLVGVPGRRDKWGIEDEVSGHCRRYDHNDVVELLKQAGMIKPLVWSVAVPASNLLFGLSNLSIARSHAAEKKGLSPARQTELSGFRDIPCKNVFPVWVTFFINRFTMWPLIFIQRFFYKTNLGLTVIACGSV